MESPSARAYDLCERKSKKSKTGESSSRKNKLVVLSFLACPAIPEDYMHACIFDLKDRQDSDDSNGNPPPPYPPLIRIEGSYGMDQGWGFCVLDSILYMSGEKKSVYTVDLSELSTCTSDNYRAEKMDAEMLSLKNSPVSMAIPMPDGTERVFVFSTRCLCKDSSLRTTIDFEIYDPRTRTWIMLPGSDKWGDDDAAVWFDISSFTVPNNKPVLLIQTDSDNPSIYALNFLSPLEGWKKIDTYSGVQRIPVTEWPHCFFVQDEICLTDYGAYDIRDPRRFFSFPQPEQLEYPNPWSYFTPFSTQVTLLGYDSNTGDCEFCVVELGLSFDDHSAWLQLCVYKFNLEEYRSEKKREKVGGEAAELHIHIHKYLFFQPVSEPKPSLCFNALYLNSF